MSNKGESKAIYPCRFPVKVIGECSLEFEAKVLSVMRGYVEDLSAEQIGRKTSGGGKYLSLTIHVQAESREYLDALYAELNALEKVIMVL